MLCYRAWCKWKIITKIFLFRPPKIWGPPPFFAMKITGQLHRKSCKLIFTGKLVMLFKALLRRVKNFKGPLFTSGSQQVFVNSPLPFFIFNLTSKIILLLQFHPTSFSDLVAPFFFSFFFFFKPKRSNTQSIPYLIPTQKYSEYPLPGAKSFVNRKWRTIITFLWICIIDMCDCSQKLWCELWADLDKVAQYR